MFSSTHNSSLWQELAGVEEKLLYQVEQKTQDLQSQLDSCDFRVRMRLSLRCCLVAAVLNKHGLNYLLGKSCINCHLLKCCCNNINSLKNSKLHFRQLCSWRYINLYEEGSVGQCHSMFWPIPSGQSPYLWIQKYEVLGDKFLKTLHSWVHGFNVILELKAVTVVSVCMACVRDLLC